MCLDSVTQKLEPSNVIESGWKEFSGTQRRPEFQNVGLKSGNNVPLDQWIKAEGTKIGSGSVSYDAGFHIYSNEREFLTRNPYRRVYFRNAHTLGKQDNKTVTVVRELFVPTDPEAWPPSKG